MKFDESFYRDIGEFLAKINRDILDMIKDIKVDLKSDNTPLTNIDMYVNNQIVDFLNSVDKDAYIVSEENSMRTPKGNFWIIDPIDGTKSLVNGKETFTTNIGYVSNGDVVFGAIGIPYKDEVYIGDVQKKLVLSFNGDIIPISSKTKESERLKLVVSSRSNLEVDRFVSLMDRLVKKHKFDIDNDGVFLNSSLKFIELALGHGDIYPRFRTISEWDIAAGHAIVKASGGEVYELDVETMDILPMKYAKKDFDSGAFLAINRGLNI